MFNINTSEGGYSGTVECDDVAFSYAISETNPREFKDQRPKSESLNWDRRAHIGGYRIFPYGDYNDLPTQIKNIIANNPTAPGLLAKKRDLVYGQGPQLYVDKVVKGVYVREWTEDEEVKQWLESWDYESYLMKQIVDYNHIESGFTKFIQGRGGRIGRPKFLKLEHCKADRSRLAVVDTNINELDATHCVVTDWGLYHINSVKNYQAYRLFDFKNPFAHRISAYYSSMYSFCQDYYTVPDIYGSLEWIRRATAIPFLLKAFSDNSLNIKYHIESPGAFWANKKEQMKEQYVEEKRTFKEEYFTKWKQEFFRKIGKVLAGDKNVGKFLHTESVMEVDGINLTETGWKINVIEQNIKEFIDSQIKISDRADRAVSAGIGLNGALGNINESARSNSGSEQLYALKNYLATGISIPEKIITKPLNYALKANFPNKKVCVGFYHMAAKAEEEIHSGDRLKETI
jgi:hypothetical protein